MYLYSLIELKNLQFYALMPESVACPSTSYTQRLYIHTFELLVLLFDLIIMILRELSLEEQSSIFY